MSNHATIRINRDTQGFDVLCQIIHPMESGNRRGPSGALITANYITRVEFQRNQSLQAEMLLGQHVSPNPVVGTRFRSLQRGDMVTVSWQDISGSNGQVSISYQGDNG